MHLFFLISSLILHLLPKFQTTMTTLISDSNHKEALEVKAELRMAWATLPTDLPPTGLSPGLFLARGLPYYFVKHSFFVTKDFLFPFFLLYENINIQILLLLNKF